ncbi:hypothetical protein Tco_0913271 [Tanacetum coccineum]
MDYSQRIYIAPSHTKKIFGNMKRAGKGFSGRITPLFLTMVLQNQAKMGEDEAVHKERGDSLVRATTTASSLEAEQDSVVTDRLKLKELMELCTNLQQRVLDLEKTKTTQAEEIGRINAIDANEDITLVNYQDDADMFDVNTLTALATLKSVKPNVKANVIEEPSVPVSAVSASTKVSAATTTTAIITTLWKGIVIAELGTSTTTTTISSKPSQAKIDEEERIARAEEENIDEAIIAWDDIQEKVDADYQLAERLQAEEQKQFIIEQKATLFKELLEQRRKHFSAKRAEEKRNKPPTQAQQRKIMCTYLKNMEGKKPKDLKNKSFDSIQKMFDRAFKRVNTFVDFRTDLVDVDDVQETAEVDDDQEAAKIKEPMKIVSDEEEVAMDAIPLDVKPPSIVCWKIHKKGKKSYYQIIRANGKSR